MSSGVQMLYATGCAAGSPIIRPEEHVWTYLTYLLLFPVIALLIACPQARPPHLPARFRRTLQYCEPVPNRVYEREFPGDGHLCLGRIARGSCQCRARRVVICAYIRDGLKLRRREGLRLGRYTLSMRV